jgi:uncharacterized protein (TIGR02246 family)
MAPGPEEKSELTKVLAVRDAWIAALRAKDIDGLMNLLTDDVVIMHPGRASVVGSAANRADIAAVLANFNVNQEAVSDETVVIGEWAFDRSRAVTRLTPVSGSDCIVSRSKAITILRRRRDGAWQIARVIGNAELGEWQTQ